MKLNRLLLAALGSAAILAFSSAKAQTILTQWNFENDSNTTTTGTFVGNLDPAASTGTGSVNVIGMTNSYNSTTSVSSPDILVGATADTGSNTIADLTNTFRIRGVNPGNGWSTQAPIATQGAQFFTSTSGITTGPVTVSFDWYVTNQAETNLEFLYTTNGGSTWTNAAVSTGSNSSAYINTLTGSASDASTVNGSYLSVTPLKHGQDWFTNLTATIVDPNALNDAGFGFELVNASTGTDVLSASGGAYNNSSGNWRFDNVTISAASTPEPVSWILGLGAVALFAVVRSVRRPVSNR